MADDSKEIRQFITLGNGVEFGVDNDGTGFIMERRSLTKIDIGKATAERINQIHEYMLRLAIDL